MVFPAPDGPARCRQEDRRRVKLTVELVKGHFVGFMLRALNSRIGSSLLPFSDEEDEEDMV